MFFVNLLITVRHSYQPIFLKFCKRKIICINSKIDEIMTSLYQPIKLIMEFYYMSSKFSPVLGFDLKMACQNFKEIGSESLRNRRKTCSRDSPK